VQKEFFNRSLEECRADEVKDEEVSDELDHVDEEDLLHGERVLQDVVPEADDL